MSNKIKMKKFSLENVLISLNGKEITYLLTAWFIQFPGIMSSVFTNKQTKKKMVVCKLLGRQLNGKMGMNKLNVNTPVVFLCTFEDSVSRFCCYEA